MIRLYCVFAFCGWYFWCFVGFNVLICILLMISLACLGYGGICLTFWLGGCFVVDLLDYLLF